MYCSVYWRPQPEQVYCQYTGTGSMYCASTQPYQVPSTRALSQNQYTSSVLLLAVCAALVPSPIQYNLLELSATINILPVYWYGKYVLHQYPALTSTIYLNSQPQSIYCQYTGTGSMYCTSTQPYQVPTTGTLSHNQYTASRLVLAVCTARVPSPIKFNLLELSARISTLPVHWYWQYVLHQYPALSSTFCWSSQP